MDSNRSTFLGSKSDVVCARVGGANTTPLSFPAVLFAKQKMNPAVVESEGMVEGGCGGNSAMPERNQTEASPAACSVRSRSQQKSFLFLLEEKIRRAQNQKNRENFFAGWRALASGGGAASLVPSKVGSREVYNYSTKCNLFGNDCSARRVRRAPQSKISLCFRRKIPEFAPITL